LFNGETKQEESLNKPPKKELLTSLKTNSEFPMPEIIGKDYPNHYQHMQEIKTYIVYYVS
jgi:hypothetical protein